MLKRPLFSSMWALARDNNPSAPGGVGFFDTLAAHNHTAGREVWARYVLDQFVHTELRIFDQVNDGIAKLGQVVGWDIGCHTDRDTLRPVQEQIGQFGGQHARLVSLPS